jgi:hypothetical protein
MRLCYGVFLFLMNSSFAMFIGNPGQPAIPTNGVIFSPNEWCSLRISCIEDYVYYQKFRDEFVNPEPSSTSAKLGTKGGLVTINIKNRLDLYTILGTAKLNLVRAVQANPEFAWGVGGKLIVFKAEHFLVGIDAKYFEFNSKPTFFLEEGMSFNLANPLTFSYSETQVSVGVSYRASTIIPYINATYLISKISPTPLISLVIWPLDGSTLIDVPCRPVVSQKNWGLSLGVTLLDQEKATFAVETRMFNQNGVNATLELRF